MDPLQVHKNGKIFLLLDTEIGAVGHIASMAILPAGALRLFLNKRHKSPITQKYDTSNYCKLQKAKKFPFFCDSITLAIYR